MIDLQDISKFYGSQKVLDQVSFSIGTGEIVGFLGPNGAGKSTTMKIITGYVSPNQGQVFVNGIAVTQETNHHKELIGYLPEHNPLYLDMYVAEYLRFVAGMYKLDSVKEKVKTVINRTGLYKEHHKKIGALSKGYRQRVGLAQAIIHNPKVLILDEPTTGLDPNQIDEVRALIKELSEERTILLSTHIMQEVESICNRSIIINSGSIVSDDKIGDYEADNYTVVVEFMNAVESSLISDLKDVISVKKVHDKRFSVQAKSDEINEVLFDFAVQTGNKTLSLIPVEVSLKDKFTSLTKS